MLGALTGMVVCGRLVGALGMRTLVMGGFFIRWKNNNLPDIERAERFLPHWDDYIYVQAQSGRYYAQALNPKLDGGWREVVPTMVGELGGEGHSDCGEVCLPWTPMIQSTAPVVGGLECGYWTTRGEFLKYSYAILENGELWRWGYKSPGLQWYLLIPLSKLAGLILGGALAWFNSSRGFFGPRQAQGETPDDSAVDIALDR